MSHHLQRMTGRGLVERARSETDRRAIQVVLSDTGWDVLRSAAPLHAAWVKSLFFSGLDAQQEKDLADILAVVYDSILRAGTLPRPD